MRAALGMSLGTLSSRFLGLFRDIIISSQFAATATDAWIVAFRIPNFMRRILGEGTLATSFIPEFVGLNESFKEQKAFRDSMFTVLSSLVFFLSLLGVIFAEPIISLFIQGEGFQAIPGKVENTIFFARIMFFFLFFISLYAYSMALLNCAKEFFWPAMAPAFFNISLIGFSLLPKSWVDQPGIYLSIGVLVGGALQFLVCLPKLIKLGQMPKPRFKIHPKVRKVFLNMIPGAVGIGILQIIGLINVAYASKLPEGANSWIYYADRVLELPLSLIAVSLGAALMPSLSEAFAKQQKAVAQEKMYQAIRFNLFLVLPSSHAFYFFGYEIVELLFYRGKFSVEALEQTTWVVKIYALSLIVFSLQKILNASFYSQKKYWLPVICSFISLLVHISIVGYLVENMGIQGLPLSTAASGFVGLVSLSYLYYKLGNRLQLGQILYASMVFTFASFAMTLAFWPNAFLYKVYIQLFSIADVARLLSVGSCIVLAASIYLATCHFLGMKEAKGFVAIIKRKIKAS